VVALLGGEGVEGLGSYRSVVLKEGVPVSLELFYGLLAILEGRQLVLCGAAGLFQLG
jgi:hypothetical protein